MSNRDFQYEDLLTRCAFIFWQIGYLPEDYQKKLAKHGMKYDEFCAMAMMFHPELTEPNQ
tara:strand:+ start:2676 stop:2855 length:180 start_codon:yes stop_codon:yes gene_type:complete